MSAHTEKRSANLENLIEDEWDILRDLKSMMRTLNSQ